MSSGLRRIYMAERVSSSGMSGTPRATTRALCVLTRFTSALLATIPRRTAGRSCSVRSISVTSMGPLATMR